MEQLQAQPTEYGGICFRSKLEAKTAQALDNIGIPYIYEPEGFQLTNGLWYKPDFYLPEVKQFIECKGKMDQTDAAKVYGLVEDTGHPILVIGYENAILIKRFFDDGDIVTYEHDEIHIAECTKCESVRFISMSDTYRCPHCGAYDGDHYLADLAKIDSGQDLFDYGQFLASNKPIYKQITDTFNC